MFPLNSKSILLQGRRADYIYKVLCVEPNYFLLRIARKKDINIDKEDYIFPRATDTIPEQIALIKTLEEKGYTYTIRDGVYFDTSKFADYASFAHLDIEGLQSGKRVEENKEKNGGNEINQIS